MPAILKRDPNPDSPFVQVAIASQAYAIGDIVDVSRSAATVIPATSSSTPYSIYGVAMEAKTASDTLMLVCLIRADQEWVVDATNASNVTYNFQRMVLTNANTINNTGTDNSTANAVFMQTGTVGAASAKKLIGKFLKAQNLTA